MPQFPGFPTNDFDFHFEEAGGALAGLLMRDRAGHVLPGVLPHAEKLLSAGEGWTIRVAPFVAARSKGRAVLLGGTTEEVFLDVDPAPSANARIDVFYSLPADVGAGDPPVGVAVAQGLPGAAPAKPVLPDGAIELGTFRVSAGNSSAATAVLTETFKFAALTGGLLYVRSTSALSQIDALEGTRAYNLADGRSAERVKGKWLSSKTVAYSSPFKAYNAEYPRINVEVEDGHVTISGMAGTTKPTDLVGGTSALIANVGADYAPTNRLVGVFQGSSSNRWAVELTPEGALLAGRYGPGTPTTNVWLPFSFTFPIKRR